MQNIDYMEDKHYTYIKQTTNLVAFYISLPRLYHVEFISHLSSRYPPHITTQKSLLVVGLDISRQNHSQNVVRWRR